MGDRGWGGIGRALARLLAADGYGLILVGRDRERLEGVGAELAERYHIGVRIESWNLSEPRAASRLWRHLSSAGIGIDILVNNAGVGLYGLVEEQDPDELDRMPCREPGAVGAHCVRPNPGNAIPKKLIPCVSNEPHNPGRAIPEIIMPCRQARAIVFELFGQPAGGRRNPTTLNEKAALRAGRPALSSEIRAHAVRPYRPVFGGRWPLRGVLLIIGFQEAGLLRSAQDRLRSPAIRAHAVRAFTLA